MLVGMLICSCGGYKWNASKLTLDGLPAVLMELNDLLDWWSRLAMHITSITSVYLPSLWLLWKNQNEVGTRRSDYQPPADLVRWCPALIIGIKAASIHFGNLKEKILSEFF